MWWPFTTLIIAGSIVGYIAIGIIIMSQLAKQELRKRDTELIIPGIIFWPIVLFFVIIIISGIVLVKITTWIACIGNKK